MAYARNASFVGGIVALCGLLVALGPAASADLGPQPREQLAELPPPPTPWQFSFTPYGWLPWISGDMVVKGRTLDVAVDPVEIIDHLDWSTLPIWMSYAEARRGPLSLFNDIVYSQLSDSGSFARSVSRRRATATFGADVKVDYQLAIVEAGGAYEIWSQGSKSSTGFTAFDLLAGARYWHQEVDVSADLTATLAFSGPLGVTISGNRAIASSGSSIGSIRSSGHACGISWRLGRRLCSAATLAALAPVANSHGRQLPPTTGSSV
jgi:hypothetical protein